MTTLFKFPWDCGKDPYFTNAEGWSWYVDSEMSKYSNKAIGDTPGLKNIYAFYVKKDKDIVRVLIDNQQNIIWEGTNLEAQACFIDALKIARR